MYIVQYDPYSGQELSKNSWFHSEPSWPQNLVYSNIKEFSLFLFQSFIWDHISLQVQSAFDKDLMKKRKLEYLSLYSS